MNPFAIISILVTVTCFLLAVYVFMFFSTYTYILICIYTVLLTYALLKHKFLGIKVNLKLLIVPLIIATLTLAIWFSIYFHLSLFALAGLSLGILCLLLAVIVFAYSKQKVHRLWALFNTVVGIWGLGTCLAGLANNPTQAIQNWKIAYLPCTFIAIVFYHLICTFCGINRTKMIVFSYIQGVLFLPFIYFSKYFINSTSFLFNSIHYHIATSLFEFWMAIFVFITCSAFFELFKFIRISQGIKRTQALYLFWGMALGWAGGLTTLLPPYNLNIIYPAWHFTICIYTFLMSYAIFRYQIMDIRIAFTRVGIFAVVYSMVLGIPFGLAIWGKAWLITIMGENWFWLPMSTLSVLSTVGPFIYLFLQRRAEAQIFKEEKRIYNLIKKASAGMVGIREIQKLLNVLIHVLKNNLRLDHAEVYLLEPNEDMYILKASKPENRGTLTLMNDGPLFDRLRKMKYPVYYEEMIHLRDNSKSENGHAAEIVTQMQQLSAAVVIPAIKEDVLLAFIVLGKREGKDVFSPELLDLLYVVGNEIALAIEIIMSLIERDKLLNDNFEKSYYAGLGYLCTSVSHQMNNRFGGVINLLYDPWETLDETNYKELPQEELVKLLDTIKDRIKRTMDIAENGGQVTKDILDLSKSKMELGIVNFDDALSKSISFVLLKRINSKLEVVKEYPKDALLWIGQAPLQDILANALDNTWFAMNLKKNHFNDPNYKPTVIVRGHVNKTMFHFEIEDNGMGIKKENLKRVLDPMFTTKSHQDGTGMGTWVMKQFIEKHGGTIVYESEWEHWTKVKISLPLATEDQKGEKKNV